MRCTIAYAYDHINDALNGYQSSNQNVFQTNDPGNQGAQPNVQGQVAPQSQVKTNTEGDIGSSGGGSSSASPSMVQATDNTGAPSAARAAVSANLGKTQTPGTLDTIQQNISDQSSGLAKKAADYKTQQEANQNYGIDTSILDKAINGDNTAVSSTTGLLGRQGINQFDSFDPGDTSVKDIGLLQNNAGLQKLAGIGRGPQYTQGMGAFDAMLLQRDPTFNSQVNSLQRQNADYQANAAAQADALKKEITDYGTQNLKTSQKTAQDYLGSQQQAILAQEQAAADAANKGLAGVDHNTIQAQAAADAQKQAQETLDAMFGQGRASGQLAGVTGVDPTKFISYASPYDSSQFVDQSQAAKFNQINQLLGLGGKAQVASGALPANYTVDTQGLLNAYKDPAIQARQTLDISDDKNIAQLLQDAGTQAADINKTNLNAVGGYSGALNSYGQSILPTLDKSLTPYETADNVSNFTNSFLASNPINSYYSTPLAANDVLSQSVADQLNALSKDRGVASSYKAGSYNPTAPTMFDQAAYQKGLYDYLRGLTPAPPLAPPTPPPPPPPPPPIPRVTEGGFGPNGNTTGTTSGGTVNRTVTGKTPGGTPGQEAVNNSPGAGHTVQNTSDVSVPKSQSDKMIADLLNSLGYAAQGGIGKTAHRIFGPLGF